MYRFQFRAVKQIEILVSVLRNFKNLEYFTCQGNHILKLYLTYHTKVLSSPFFLAAHFFEVLDGPYMQ